MARMKLMWRVALLEFAKPAQRRLRYPCRARSRTRDSSVRGRRLAILRRGRWGRGRCGRVSRRRRLRAVPGQLATHIRGRGEVRHGSTGEDVSRTGRVHVGIVDAWVVVVVCAWEGDGLVGSARLGAADADLRAGCIELGPTECHGLLEAEDLVTD
jgi:hypothetical protein